MAWLLDTNILSELRRPSLNRGLWSLLRVDETRSGIEGLFRLSWQLCQPVSESR